MRKMVAKEVFFCDVCRREQYIALSCKNCGTEMCSFCWEHHGQVYSSNIFVSQGYDGHYCNFCDRQLRLKGTNKLHAAYLQIRELRLEMEQWNEAFTARQK